MTLFKYFIKRVLKQLPILPLRLLVRVRLHNRLIILAYERLHFIIQLVIIINHTKHQIIATILYIELFNDVLAGQIRQPVHLILLANLINILCVRIERVQIPRIHVPNQILDYFRRSVRFDDQQVGNVRVALVVYILRQNRLYLTIIKI